MRRFWSTKGKSKQELREMFLWYFPFGCLFALLATMFTAEAGFVGWLTTGYHLPPLALYIGLPIYFVTSVVFSRLAAIMYRLTPLAGVVYNLISFGAAVLLVYGIAQLL